MQEANATKLPAELVNEVALYMTRALHRGNKRGLASCSLVCRYWARLITPTLFQTVTVRSAEDVTELVSFIDAPARIGISLADCIQWFTAECHGPQTSPWLHHLRGLGQRCRNLHEYRIHIDNVSVVSARLRQPLATRFSTLSWTLPRTLPRSCYTPIGVVYLSDMALQHEHELIILLDSLPRLRRSVCRRVTFRDSEPRVQCRLPVALRSQRLFLADVEGCGNGTPVTQFDLAMNIIEPRKRVGIAQDIWSVLLKAARALLPEDCWSVRIYILKNDGTDNSENILIVFGESGNFDKSLIIRYEVPAGSSATEERRHVPVTELNIYGDLAAPADTKCRAFETALLELDDVPSLEINVRLGVEAYRTLLDGALRGALFSDFRRANRFSLNHPDGITITAITNSLSKYVLDDAVLTLTPVEQFDYLRLQASGKGR